MTNVKGMSKSEPRDERRALPYRSFGFRAFGFFGHLSFVIRICAAPAVPANAQLRRGRFCSILSGLSGRRMSNNQSITSAKRFNSRTLVARRLAGFTLIELLVVIAIIAI